MPPYGGAHTLSDCHRTGVAPTTNWAEFAIGLRRQFEPVNAVRVARDKLARLRQDKSVQDYTARFRTLVLQVPDMSEAELMDRFIRGLKPAAQRELELHPPATFDDAVILTERVDAVEWRVRSHATASSSSRPAPSIRLRTPSPSRQRRRRHADGAWLLKAQAAAAHSRSTPTPPGEQWVLLLSRAQRQPCRAQLPQEARSQLRRQAAGPPQLVKKLAAPVGTAGTTTGDKSAPRDKDATSISSIQDGAEGVGRESGDSTALSDRARDGDWPSPIESTTSEGEVESPVEGVIKAMPILLEGIIQGRAARIPRG